MQSIEPLIAGNFYHIYNRGIDGCDLFLEQENYDYFLKLHKEYITPIAETYAWVLMKNHFHFLLRLKEPTELYKLDNYSVSDISSKPPYQHFSNLFNTYSKAFNKKYFRHGGLMERPFKRKKIEEQKYLKNALIYINNNPVHHEFCNKPEEYKWSSYNIFLSEKPPDLFQKVILEWFDDVENFRFVHYQKMNDEFENSFE